MNGCSFSGSIQRRVRAVAGKSRVELRVKRTCPILMVIWISRGSCLLAPAVELNPLGLEVTRSADCTSCVGRAEWSTVRQRRPPRSR
ncbi:hypothetical protein RRG08_046286 [Elysia crispata]|uniref:Uncharacterized protein n=1 Tax=Elysia crispata TaxID=231223 RepID=A0AAE1D190_9GAST|nr:hypothetical protein RRG08_046286 [Elysia crispata]